MIVNASIVGPLNKTGGGAYRPQELAFRTPYLIELVIVGGGAGGGTSGGGGGGGYYYDSIWVTPGTTYTVTVGAGGSAGSYPTPGTRGSDSKFGNITAVGGGASNRDQGTMFPGMGVGGSGAGVGATSVNNSSVHFAAVSGQGNVGGSAAAGGTNYAGGGGGGAGGAGGNATDSTTSGGTGGIGTVSAISGTSVCGGGGGGYLTAVTNQTMNAGTYGGGNGGYRNAVPSTVSPTAGTANTGGGGGGGSSAGNGAAGGSGRVELQYPGAKRHTGTTGSPTDAANGGNWRVIWTSSGTFTA